MWRSWREAFLSGASATCAGPIAGRGVTLGAEGKIGQWLY